MALGDVTRESVLKAVDEFDDVGREAFLGRYGFGAARGYFLVVDGRRYDSKAIVGAAHVAATGVSIGPHDFNGGERTVARLLESLRFDVERPKANPDWTMDELILTLDLYLATRGQISYSPRVPEVIGLSEILRGLRIFPPEVTQEPRFRNPAGVALKLHNLSAVDPGHSGAGMSHGSRLDREVWKAWAHRPEELRQAAALIRSEGASRDAATETGEDEEFSAEEGQLLYRRHRARERDRRLVRRKLDAARRATGRVACEVCGLDPVAKYGEKADEAVDVHHVVPLHLAGESTTRLRDLAVVCPTCHRVLHRHRPVVTPFELSETVRVRAGGTV